MQIRYLGEDVKIIVRATPVDGMTLADFDWVAHLWTNSSRIIQIPKNECIPQDGGAFVIRLNTLDVGTGSLKLKIVAEIPDADFSDGFRTTIGATTIMTILKNYAGS